ncbi:hypothetical protein F4780DRAFT_206852 [Xylariomycetidae sp. FL0641]|nr:hypothetical protein F4780DRAFT_206852 [Xylariomycetidae sp. FL0641]
MVGLVGRFRKPKSPVVLGSPHKDDNIPHQTPATPLNPILRNFSYPISAAQNTQPSSFPIHSRQQQSTWDQLGEICNFSPESVSRAGQRTAGLEDPFFYKSDRGPYSPLTEQSSRVSSKATVTQPLQPSSPCQEDPKARKRQRRSALLGLSSSQAQDTSRL